VSSSPSTELEHRWGQRFQVNIPVQVSIGLLRGIDGRLQNLSCSGGLLTADYRLRLHSLLEMQIRLPVSGHALIKAHVTRASDGVVGLEWSEFASRAIKLLVREALALTCRAHPAAAQKDKHPMFLIPFEGAPNAKDAYREAAVAR
jgi:hypothetical protein